MVAMLSKLLVSLLLIKLASSSSVDGHDFTYNGFRGVNLSLNGVAAITPDGLLRLTNTSLHQIGRAFYSVPVRFKNSSDGDPFSFSTTFVFAIVPAGDPDLSGHGIAFVISPLNNLPGAHPSQYLGLFNLTNNGNSSNHIVAVEFDTIINPEFNDINNNHVGIDINGLSSIKSSPASYFNNKNGEFNNISLKSGKPIQAWIEYSSIEKQLNITISPIDVLKPIRPLVSSIVNLSSDIFNEMYVGFSSSTGSMLTSHYILGWSFKINGQATPLNLSTLPILPQLPHQSEKKRMSEKKWMVLAIGLPLFIIFILIAISIGVYKVRKKIKFAEILEDWELEYGPQRFFYKDLFIATNGFSEKELLGVGGFGRVYRGVLPTSGIEVAVKKISHESRQGMKEFIAEIASIGRIRHKNLVRLLGYCRRKGELLLVYDFMPNGSLDKMIFDHSKSVLQWNNRFQIIKGVASGLVYLHEDWVQVVLHRDIKASNVLLDHDLNGMLGDFGLARLYDRGTDPQTTHIVGTFGYIAPELARTGKATMSTDVFAFGIFMLEVACGRRPISSRAMLVEEPILIDLVLECLKRETILEAADPKLGGDYVVEEMEMVLKLGLLCSHPLATSRPTIRQVVEILDGEDSIPELCPDSFDSSVFGVGHDEGFEDLVILFPSLDAQSFVSGGR
ncbi:L-type lectin-domain containing receptor kinase IV.1-like [Magnolia sinica]|uniref:L-type lectin-domain containing receptor kinase IV.1-like n=1 Tax=Magnolia sinica TaxID=86752 RepID=UPI00265B07A0|nr:L-type lectin-domain containing receptor kinase IV.1-like [Magnolia sinica]